MAQSVSTLPDCSIDWPRLAGLLRSAQRVLLTSHVRPDCDALGSELGMAGLLAALGKEVVILNAHATPPNLAFIDPDRKLRTLGRDVPADRIPPHDLLIVLDTSAWAQLGEMGDVIRASQATKIVLDHHQSADDLGAEEFKNTKAEATGRLVAELAGHLGVKITPEIALPLFAALATDTGWFRFGSTSAGTLRCAADLVAAGARPDRIWNALYEQDTLARLQLRGRIIARSKSELGGRLIYTEVHLSDFAETGALPSDTEDVINLTLAVAGTEVAAIFVEQQEGGIKLSLRSRGAIDCSQMTKRFGGGGHKAAAGALMNEPLAVARERVLDALREAMK